MYPFLLSTVGLAAVIKVHEGTSACGFSQEVKVRQKPT